MFRELSARKGRNTDWHNTNHVMRKKRHNTNFSQWLAKLRKQQGLTQQQLAEAIQVSRRVIAYYEAESDNPPAHLLIRLAHALHVSADELLGLQPVKNPGITPSLKVARRMKKIETLPLSAQKFILKAIDAHLKAFEH